MTGPFRTSKQQVLPSWIDYNGHMNVAYYTLALDQAMDAFLSDALGIGPDYVARVREGPYALQAHYHYLGELLEGASFYVDLRLLDFDAKRMHLFAEMFDADGAAAASVETVLLNVDLEARKAAPYAPETVAKLTALKIQHDQLERPVQIGAPLGLKRAKG